MLSSVIDAIVNAREAGTKEGGTNGPKHPKSPAIGPAFELPKPTLDPYCLMLNPVPLGPCSLVTFPYSFGPSFHIQASSAGYQKTLAGVK